MEKVRIDAPSTTDLENFGGLLTAKDLSEFFGVSLQAIYKEIKDGKCVALQNLGKPCFHSIRQGI